MVHPKPRRICMPITSAHLENSVLTWFSSPSGCPLRYVCRWCSAHFLYLLVRNVKTTTILKRHRTAYLMSNGHIYCISGFWEEVKKHMKTFINWFLTAQSRRLNHRIKYCEYQWTSTSTWVFTQTINWTALTTPWHLERSEQTLWGFSTSTARLSWGTRAPFSITKEYFLNARRRYG